MKPQQKLLIYHPWHPGYISFGKDRCGNGLRVEFDEEREKRGELTLSGFSS